MRVVIRAIATLPGVYRDTEVAWPDDWPVPRADESISLSDGTRLRIRTIDWCPQGTEEDPEPVVYVVAR